MARARQVTRAMIRWRSGVRHRPSLLGESRFLIVHVEQSSPAHWRREIPQRYSFISCKTRGCVDKAGDAHWHACLLSAVLKSEGHHNLKHAPLESRIGTTEGIETGEARCQPRTLDNRAIRVELCEGAARYDCSSCSVETSGAGHCNLVTGTRSRDLWPDKVEAVGYVSGRCEPH